jgi:mxaA protein
MVVEQYQQMKIYFILFTCLFLVSYQVIANEAKIEIIEQSVGRDFGVLVGDLIQHDYVVEVPAELSLSSSSLPSKGELTYWLDLVDVQYQQIALEQHSRRYQLSFIFQTFYAPLDVRILSIPELALRFNRGERTEKFMIPVSTFTMSPLKETTPMDIKGNKTQHTFMKPDLEPELIKTESLKIKRLLLFISAIVLIVIWAMLKGILFSFSRSSFQRACRQVKGLKKVNRKDSSNFEQAIQVVHQAFNCVAQQALFSHQVAFFVQQHPEFKKYQQNIEDFYALSTTVLYGKNGDKQQGFDQLLHLCVQLSKAERVTLRKK